MPKFIPLLTLESRIKRNLRNHLRKIGFVKDSNGMLNPPKDNKKTIRKIHSLQRIERLKENSEFLQKNSKNLLKYFRLSLK